ncbi:hypothetical protein [Nocardia sp. NPDC051832]|uniref:hypothetical protein n=1 Tax=Nocardia sp. NPDC051832 TaxID=3155673 RepID=UPI00342CC8EF
MTTEVLAASADVLIEGAIEDAREYRHPTPEILGKPLQRLEIRENHGEPPMLSATPASVAAIRDARRSRGTTVHINRVPEPPEDIIRSC